MHPGILDQQALRALRANRIFRTDEKRIRTENAVLVNTRHNAGGLYEIEAAQQQEARL